MIEAADIRTPESIATAEAKCDSLQRLVMRQFGDCTLYNADCLDVLAGLKADAVITDPPYGIAYDTAQEKQSPDAKQIFDAVIGDEVPFDAKHLMGYRDVILWGANNYSDQIPKGGQWYFWDKVVQNGLKVRISEAEYAWHKRGTKPRGFRHMWCGPYKASERGIRAEHPTQKPIALMQWCVELAKLKNGDTVLDPYMGSGSTGIACIRAGIKFIGIEKDKRHFETACERIRCELAQGVLLPHNEKS